MTRPTVSSRIVGTPDDRKSALSVVMSGIRKPNPITIPAASMAWTTMMSGSIAPVIASDQRSNDRKRVQRLTWIGATGSAAEVEGVGAADDSDMGGLLAGRCSRDAGARCRVGGRGESQVGVLERRRGQREAVDPTLGALTGGPGDSCRGLVRRDGEQRAPSGPHPAQHR